MKNSLFIFLFVISLIVGIVGMDNEINAEEQIHYLRFATSSTASTGHIYGSAIASIVNRYSDKVNIAAFASGGSLANDQLLRTGNVQLAMGNSGVVVPSYNGLQNFEGKPFEEMRVMWLAYPPHVNIIVPKDSEIETIADLKGKRMGVGAPGTATYSQIEDVLNLYGISYEDVIKRPLTLSEQVEAMVDGNIDVISILMGTKTPALEELAFRFDVRWLSISDEKWEQLKAESLPGYYFRTTIPAGTYTGQDYDVKTLGSMNMWTTTSNLSEEIVYEIVKTFWEHKDEADMIHPIIKYTPTVINEDELPVPLHQGAKRYFKEVGMLAQ